MPIEKQMRLVMVENSLWEKSRLARITFLAKTQNDPVPEIRTNTVICLGKIAPHLSKSSMCGVLVTAFTKSMKDPKNTFSAECCDDIGTSIDLFEPGVCYSCVLSAIAPCLLDRSSRVQHEADKVLRSYMAKIRTASESLPEDDESVQQNEMHQQKELKKTMLGVSFGWPALSNLSDRMAGEMKAEEGPHQRQHKVEVSEPNNWRNPGQWCVLKLETYCAEMSCQMRVSNRVRFVLVKVTKN